MSATPTPFDFYVAGGTMRPNADSYVVRSADRELFEALQRGELCYVLSARQLGKSSLMARTAARLRETGILSAHVTLETARASIDTPQPDQFMFSVAHQIHGDLSLATPLAEWWQQRALLSPTQRFSDYLTDLLIAHVSVPMVIFIDEIDSTIGQPFGDDFYATLRACYNRRATKPELQRLSFVLSGVATPAQLIADPVRTPFNVGRGITLTDFTEEEASPLGDALPASVPKRAILLRRALDWTGGHPYLTQTLCRAIALDLPSAEEHGDVDLLRSFVDGLVRIVFLHREASREESNLKFVRRQLIERHEDPSPVLALLARIVEGDSVEDEPTSPVHAAIKLAGVAQIDPQGYLRTRNRIYERVFDRDWVAGEMRRAKAPLVELAHARLIERLTAADFEGLMSLARDQSYPWTEVRKPLDEDVVSRIDPRVFVEAPWLVSPLPDPKAVLDVIERCYPVLAANRPMFGALAFALEEVWLRWPRSPEERRRAASLSQRVIDAVVAHHSHRTPGFLTLNAKDETLNSWVALDPGEFRMGFEEPPPTSRRPAPRSYLVSLSGFVIQQHPVTNAEYRRFDPGHAYPNGHDNHPVTNISWYEANGYAAWLGASLPTEAEWEYAARGREERTYPWGSEPPTDERAVFGNLSAGTAPVGSRPLGFTPSPAFLQDVAGNVWEWCRDPYAAKLNDNEFDPLGPTPLEGVEIHGSRARILRGGSFASSSYVLLASFRGWSKPSVRVDFNGFRLVGSRFVR